MGVRGCLADACTTYCSLAVLCAAGLGQSKYISWPRMRPQFLNWGLMSDFSIEFHASLILCLMLCLVSGGPSNTRCLQTLNRELSRGERRLAAAGGINMIVS